MNIDFEFIIKRAIDAKNCVTMIYEKDGVYTQRKILPYAIEQGEVSAYCYLRKGKRKFRLDHILSVVPQEAKEK